MNFKEMPVIWKRPDEAPGAWDVLRDQAGECGDYFLVKYAVDAEALPTEFFSRELMECNASDDREVALFMVRYGILRSPLRYKPAKVDSSWTLGEVSRVFGDIDFTLREFEGIGQTDALGLPGLNCISMNEAAAALFRLQAMSRAALKYSVCSSLDDLSEAEKICLDTVWACAIDSTFIDLGVDPHVIFGRSSLFTRALCGQMRDYIKDDAQARHCWNCGRIFKRKRSETKTGPRPNARCCCVRCDETARKRGYRMQSGKTKAPRARSLVDQLGEPVENRSYE